jgi:hypothetical protein
MPHAPTRPRSTGSSTEDTIERKAQDCAYARLLLRYFAHLITSVQLPPVVKADVDSFVQIANTLAITVRAILEFPKRADSYYLIL